MRPPPHVPPADAAVLDALAGHADKILDGWHATAHRSGWKPVAGSYCEDERRRLRRQYGPGGDWNDIASEVAVGFSNLLLAVTAQHLEALIALLRARQVMFAPAVLVRSALEHRWLRVMVARPARDRPAARRPGAPRTD